MRPLASGLFLFLVWTVAFTRAEAADPCKVCSEQQKACMKNYAGPACKTEFRICMKSCKTTGK